FIDFDDSHQLAKLRFAHSGAKAMAHVPSRMRGRAFAEKHSPNLQRRNAFFGLEHRIKHLEPRHDRHLCIGEDRPRSHRKAECITLAAFLIGTFPVKRPRLERVDLSRLTASRTCNTLRPTPITKELTASGFVREGRHK